VQRQEGRRVAREGPEVGRRDAMVFGPDHPVDEADGEIQAVWIAQDPGQPSAGRGDRQAGGVVEPRSDLAHDIGQQIFVTA